MFYTYIYYDQQNLPYYVGKGCKSRVFHKHVYVSVPIKSKILIQYWESEKDAFEMEEWWISFWGRKDLGTGILDNRTSGGADNFSKGLTFKILSDAGKLGIQKMSIEQRSCGGRTNVMSGHLERISSKGGKSHIKSGHLARLRSLISSEQRSQTTTRFNHFRWHVKRGKIKVNCIFCLGAV